MATASSYPLVKALGFGYDPKVGYYVTVDGKRLPAVGQWYDDELEVTGLREESMRTYLTMTRTTRLRPKQ